MIYRIVIKSSHGPSVFRVSAYKYHGNIKLPFSRFAFLKVDWRVRGTTIRLEKAYALTDEAHWNTNSLRTSTNSLYSKQPRINAPLVLLAWLSTTDFTYMQAIYELNTTVRSSILLHVLYIFHAPLHIRYIWIDISRKQFLPPVALVNI